MRAVTKTVLGLGMAGAGVLGWASLVERNAFVLRRFDVPVLPDGAAPLRVLHLSDLHLLPRQRAKRGVGAQPRLARPRPRHHDGRQHRGARRRAVAARRVRPRSSASPGSSSSGSNDYFAPKLKNPLGYLTRNHAKGVGTTLRLPTADLLRGLGSRGWIDLTNRRDSITVRGLRIDVRGVDDPHLGYDRLDLVGGPGLARTPT